MKRTLPLLTIFFFTLSLHAQQRAFRNYNVRDGLGHSVVYRVMQDRSGFLWFGTDYGLSRFDGRVFRNFLLPGQANSQVVMGLAQDRQGKIWIAYLDGHLAFIDPARNNSLSLPPEINSKLPATLVAMTIDHAGRFWLIDKEWRLYCLSDGRLRSIVFPVKVKHVNAIKQLGDSTLLAATSVGVFRLDASGKAVPYNRWQAGKPVYCMAEDSRGTLWLSGNAEIYRIPRQGKASVIKLAVDEPVRVLCVDAGNRLWISGVATQLSYFEKDHFRPVQVGSPQVKQIFNEITADNQGNLWLASYGYGVFCLSATGIDNYSPGFGLSGEYIHMLGGEEKGRVWVGTMGQLHYIDERNVSRSQVRFRTTDESAHFILRLKNNRYLLATSYSIYLTDTGMHTVWFQAYGCRCYLQEPGGDVLMGTYRGIYIYRAKEEKFYPYPLQGLDNRRINSMLRDSLGRLWVATDSGLFYSEGSKTGQFTVAQGLGHLSVSQVLLDGKGRVWAATKGGLSCINAGQQNLSCVNYNTLKGLSHDHCTALALDEQGGLWVATYKGLNYFNGRHFIYLSEEDGLISDETTRLWMDGRKNLWVGTVKGLSRIDLEALHFNVRPPSSFLDAVEINSFPADLSKFMRLAPGRNNLKITLGAVELSNPGTVMFSYKLEHEPEWSYTSGRQIEYSSLSPGDYTFVFRSRNSNSDWSNPVYWSFSVWTPLWQRLWFILSTTILLLAVLVFFTSRRIAGIRKTAQERLNLYKRMQLLRQQNLSAHLNPHFIFNSLNALQHFLNTYDRHSANEYLGDFARLIRATMDDSEHTFITLRKEIERLELYFSIEKIRFREKLQYSVLLDPDIEPDEVYVPAMIMQPYVENAIWHGLLPKDTGGVVNVRISWIGTDLLQILIEDNGIGFRPGSQASSSMIRHEPKGRRIMEERFDLLRRIFNRRITVSTDAVYDSQGCVSGTRVSIILPSGMNEMAW